MNITKIELCNRIAQRFNGVPVATLKPVLEAFLDEILDALSEGRKIEFRGFGTFMTKMRKSRMGRNPRTGKSVDIPECTAPVFKFSKDAQKTFNIKKAKVKERRMAAFKPRKKRKDSSSAPAETTEQPKQRAMTADRFTPS